MADTKQQKSGAKPSKKVMKKRHAAGNGNEPTKEEYAVAKFVRFKCPTKKTQFGHGSNGEEVNYFVGSKAVDCLMESKWSKASKKQQPLFTDRRSCIDYMQELLMKGLFFRARKLVPKIKEKPTADEKKKDQPKKITAATTETKEETHGSPKIEKETEVKRRKKDKKSQQQEKDEDPKEVKEKEKEKDDGENNGNDKGKEKTSKARKVKLDFHAEQLFIDGPSIYVWKYDPTSLKTFLLGLGIVLGAIALCLFPLWPLQIRAGVYYLSVGAMCFFGAFIGLVALRALIFGIVWAVSFGRHSFWLLPNLTEDCGVFESFKPWYSYKYKPRGSKADDKEEKKKDKKSDSEDEDVKEEEGEEEIKDGQTEDEDARERKEDQIEEDEEDRGSDSGGSENEEEEHGNNGESVTASQDDDDDEDNEKSDDASSNSQSARTSTDEESVAASKEKILKKRNRRDDSNNGDYEFVENPSKGD